MLSTMDLVFKEEFKNKYIEYNTIATSDGIATSAKRVARNCDCSYVKPNYFIPIDIISGSGSGRYVSDVIKCKTERTNTENISKRVTFTKNITPYTEEGNNNWVFEVNFGEQFEIKPGTLQVTVNYNDVTFSDNMLKLNRHYMNGDGIDSGTDFDQNIGSLVTSSQFALGDGNYVLYDSVSNRFIPELSGTEYTTNGLANLRFVLYEDYMTIATEVPVQISFETTCDLFCEYQGYDPNEFYVYPANIRSDF